MSTKSCPTPAPPFHEALEGPLLSAAAVASSSAVFFPFLGGLARTGEGRPGTSAVKQESAGSMRRKGVSGTFTATVFAQVIDCEQIM